MSWLRLMEEAIKENEPPLTGEQPEVVESPTPRKKHSVSGLIKDMWPAYLIEIIVIILGISITLALEEWRDVSREKELGQIYEKNLLRDVEADLQFLRNEIASTQKLLKRGNELLGYIRNPFAPDIPLFVVIADVRAIIDRPVFTSNDATFSDLKNSGNLHLLKDIQLKNLLFSYYSETQHITELQNAEQQSTIILSGNYFLKRFPLGDTSRQAILSGPENLHEILSSAEFDNNVLLRVSNREEILQVYKNADSLGTSLKNELIRKTEY